MSRCGCSRSSLSMCISLTRLRQRSSELELREAKRIMNGTWSCRVRKSGDGICACMYTSELWHTRHGFNMMQPTGQSVNRRIVTTDRNRRSHRPSQVGHHPTCVPSRRLQSSTKRLWVIFQNDISTRDMHHRVITKEITLNHIHSVHHFTKHDVLAVEPWCLDCANKKL
jgi:hypothetical protein